MLVPWRIWRFATQKKHPKNQRDPLDLIFSKKTGWILTLMPQGCQVASQTSSQTCVQFVQLNLSLNDFSVEQSSCTLKETTSTISSWWFQPI